MKKTILSFLLMFVTMATFASRWTAPATGEYSDRFVVYTQVNINGTPRNYDVEVAAFIDGQVRGVADASKINQNGHLTLEVFGNDGDNEKTITFKIAYNNLVYKSTKTLFYKHTGTQAPIPFVLNVDAITGVKLPETIELTQNIGTTYDLTNDITLLYEPLNVDGAPAQYTKLNETTLDTDVTPLTYDWDYANSSSWFEVGANNVLKVNGFCESKNLGLKVQGPVDESIMSTVAQFEVSTFTNVTIIKPTVPVTSLTLSQSSFEMYVGENAATYLNSMITILPVDATNKQWFLYADAGTPARAAIDADNIARTPGTYAYKVMSLGNADVYADVTITIKQKVQSLSWDTSDMKIELWKGENAYTAIAGHVTVNPANATDKTLTFTCADQAAFSATGIAQKKGSFTVYVGAVDAGADLNPLPVNVEVRERVESITATPNTISVKVGDLVDDYIKNNVTITVLPATASNKEYTVAPKASDVSAFPGMKATTPGTYTWVVTSVQNPEITADITVNVITPVTFTLPSMIDLTLLTLGQGNITNITGDYDASLVSFGVQEEAVEVAMSGTTISVTGKKLGDGEFEVFYDGESMGMVSFNVNAEIKLQSGWNWMSNYTSSDIDLMTATGYLPSLFTGTSKILEARSQKDLLYNDTENYGVFGTIDKFESNTMYKVRVEGDRSLIPTGYVDDATPLSVSTKGYTWIGYPVVGDHSIDYINNENLVQAYTGCLIMGKDGFAEHSNGKWVASAGFKLETGKGYIFYQPEARDLSLDFGDHYVTEAFTSNAKAAFSKNNVWSYDASSFADNMAIVAKIDGIEASSRYSIGAFVGDECRGKGEFVTNEVMFINVAGIAGEKVNFRLYDSETGCYSDVLESMSYTMKKGTVGSPVTLTPEATITGISNVETSVQSNAKAFNVNGQQVNSNAKGLLIIGGKKIMKK